MHVVTFDIDDTLIRAEGMDDTCFLRAVEAVFGLTDIDPKWDTYPHVTESGIIGALVRQFLKREVTPEEWATFEKKSLQLLVEELDAHPGCIKPLPGAQVFLNRLTRDPNVAVAFATGGWRPSALIKLAAAGFDTMSIPMASCGDRQDRGEIVLLAQDRAQAACGVSGFDARTHIGDRVADMEAAQAAQAGFIGVAQDPARARMLHEGGAMAVISDFSDGEALLDLLKG